MLRRLTGLGVILALVGCMPPPSRPAGAPHAGIGSDEVLREQARLSRLAEERREEYQRRVERVGRRLLEHMSDPPRVQFLIDGSNPQINAGATFGQVIVTAGLLDFAESDDELAMVLGHEIAHITEGHVTKGLIGSLALNVLAIVVESQAPGLGNTAGGIGQLFLNRYTQSQEREADEVGLRNAYGAGFDPRAAGDVQERLAVRVPETMTAGYFDTHPSSVERMIAARKQAEELLAQGPPPGREEVLAIERAERERYERASAPAEPPRAYREQDAAPSDDEDCRKAEAYLRRAEDSADAAESERLYRRAIRYCPELAAAREGLERLRGSRSSDEEDDDDR